jgi:peptidoglycan/LPS O-acetylase OafA/YrhL
MNKILSIQALRGIAVLGVVLFHSFSIEQKYSGGDFLLPDFLRMGQTGVDLFFVISGFVMVTVTKGRFARRNEMGRFLWGRLTRIYPTYWFYFSLTAVVLVIKPGWVNSSQGHQVHLLSSFLLLPSDQLPLVMVAWSLIYEMWFYLVFTILLRFHECLLLPSLLVWGTIVTTVNLVTAIDRLPPGLQIILHPYSLEFITGALIALFLARQDTAALSRRSAILILALVLAAGFPLAYRHNVIELPGLSREITIGLLFGLLLLSCATLENHRFTPPKFLQFIGDISYSIYLSHVLVLSAIGRLWLRAWQMPESFLDNIAACLVMLAAVIAYGWVGYRLIERPILHISHHLRARWFEKSDSNRQQAASSAA